MGFLSKLKQRKGLAAVFLSGAFFLALGGQCIWRGATHNGVGWLTVGGDVRAPDGHFYEEETISVSQRVYRRNSYVGAGMFLVLGAILLDGFVRQWKERNKLERSWANFQFYPQNRVDLEKNPELFREDMVEHIRQTRPNDMPPPDHAG